MLPIGLFPFPSPSIVLLVIACLSKRASGSMRILHLTTLTLLAGFAYATPISSHALLRNHTANSLPGITPTSTDSPLSAISDLPTFGTCRAFYYDPKDDVPCGVVARQFTIFLTYPEYDQPSTAQWCEVFLNGNGICRATSPNSPSAFPTSKPSTLSISTAAPTTDTAAPANTFANASANASTSALCMTTSSSDTAGSPVAAIVFGNGSIVSIGSAAATARTETSTRGPVVLASVRASEYSATVNQTSSNTVASSPKGLTPSDAPLAGSTSLPAANTSRPAINATRTISYNLSHGNATSVRTVLVTAHVASGASTMAPAIASAGVVSGLNLTLAAHGVRARRRASPLALTMNANLANLMSSPTYQAVNVEPATLSGPLELLGSTTPFSLLAPTATNQPTFFDVLASSIAPAGVTLSASASTRLTAATPEVLAESTGYVEIGAHVPWTASSEISDSVALVSQADLASSSAATAMVFESTSAELAEPTSSYTFGLDQYISYHGDGAPEHGWPQMSEWLTWDDFAAANWNLLTSACTYWAVKENSPDEVDSLLSIILRVAGESQLDPRVLLAVILQESHGCLRVPSTMGSHKNPGILQSHIGDGSCNTNMINAGEPGPMEDDSLVWETCPASQIETMVRDGALGTPAGDGILQLLQKEQSGGYGDAQMWYRVARGYNSGSVDASNALELGAATHAYASDIANRLTGWNTGPSPFA